MGHEMDFKKSAEENRILEVRVGSHLFGTDDENSDLDLFGIFMPFKETVYGFQRCEEVDLSSVSKDDTGRNTAMAVDRKLHEYRKFIKLAMQNNPNILHVLMANAENVVYCNDFGARLLKAAKLFPHKGAYHRFVAYANGQRHKMQIRSANYAALERGLEVLEETDGFRTMGELRALGPFVDKDRIIKCGDLNFESGVLVKKARQRIRSRLAKASNRAELFTKYGYDTKFASNLIQLLLEGRELVTTGWINFPLARADLIREIKAGKYTAEDIQKVADEILYDSEKAYEITELPDYCDHEAIEAFTINEVRSYLEGRCK
jgi:predicted nucleotidyltransferase